MKRSENETTNELSSKPDTEYEAPRIELLVTGQELEREVHYAGANSPTIRP